MRKSLFAGGIICLMLGGGIKYITTPAHAQLRAEEQKPNTSKVRETPQKPQLKVPQPPTVKLLNPGTEPRQQLRFKPVAGSKQKSVMMMKTDMKMSLDGKPVPAFTIPATVVTIDTVINKVESNGDISYNFSYSEIDVVEDPKIDPKLIEAMRKQLPQLNGVKGSGVMDNRGNTKKINLVTSDIKDPFLKQITQQLSSSLSKVSSPVPQEAVGKGAQWSVINKIGFNGINLTQTETYNLVDIKDGVATLQAQVQQQAQKMQKVTLPGLPPSAALTLQSYDGNGQGKSQIMLDKLMPITSNVSVSSNLNWNGKFTSKQENMDMSQEVLVQVNMESK